MKERLTTSIVLYGKINTKDVSRWSDYYHKSIELVKDLNMIPNYLGITGESFKSGKITTLVRTEKKLLKSLESGEEIESLEIYSLPDGFTTAAFDYDIYICRTKQIDPPHLLVTFSNELYDCLNQDGILSQLKEFIEFESGQIFQLTNLESPQIYASKANSISSFKTLKIIKEF